MKILVLGHKGMLGSDLTAKLGISHEVVGKDIDDFDISSAADCRDVVAEAGPEAVVNAAAYTDVDGCETEEDLCFRVNAEGVRNVAAACRKKNSRLVHFSTDYVFDGTKGEPYVEEDPANPISAYGRSKLQGEIYLRESAADFLLVRTAWLYGKKGRNFVKAIVARAREKEKLEVVNDQFGSPTYTVDLAGAVKILLEGKFSGIYHITNRGSCSWYEFAQKILEISDLREVEIKPISTEELARRALRPRYSVMSCGKFHAASRKTLRFWQIALNDYISSDEQLK
ncbi:MAG TPA: dTDP-4-dehydrorhamnose reductase [Syntrophales bacterium]|nr:dTDP-4-dehydrorhamnose reductase [Syntrophales bacterium]